MDSNALRLGWGCESSDIGAREGASNGDHRDSGRAPDSLRRYADFRAQKWRYVLSGPDGIAVHYEFSD